jgi:predicted dehydrogenase
MKKVIWGVLSTAKIGTQKVIPAMQQSEWCDIRAIASRTYEDARRVADALGIKKAYGSYEELLVDPEIEAIYNPLPNHLHVPFTLKAVEAGKHVLCEKPIALSADEAKKLIPTVGKALVMEAFMVRFHPQWLLAREFIQQGKIGTLRSVQVFFSYFNNDPTNIRNQASIGGGAVYDIGCYAIVAARFLFGTEARRVIALFDRDPTFGTDRTVCGLVDFGNGRQLDFTVSTQSAPCQRVLVNGTEGRIELPIPFNPNPEVIARIFRDDGSSLDDSSRSTETLALSNQYTLQGTAFSRAIRGEMPLPYGVDDAINNLRIIDAIFRSEKSGRWEDV